MSLFAAGQTEGNRGRDCRLTHCHGKWCLSLEQNRDVRINLRQTWISCQGQIGKVWTVKAWRIWPVVISRTHVLPALADQSLPGSQPQCHRHCPKNSQGLGWGYSQTLTRSLLDKSSQRSKWGSWSCWPAVLLSGKITQCLLERLFLHGQRVHSPNLSLVDCPQLHPRLLMLPGSFWCWGGGSQNCLHWETLIPYGKEASWWYQLSFDIWEPNW